MDLDARRRLVEIARLSASAWQRTRGRSFRGDTVIATEEGLYRFTDGIFAGGAPLPSGADEPVWITPPVMCDLELIGFLADEGGFYSFTPRWHPGALAVLWNPSRGEVNEAFTLTAPTIECTIEEDEPEEVSSVRRVSSPMLSVPRPPPDSMTRIQAVPKR